MTDLMLEYLYSDISDGKSEKVFTLLLLLCNITVLAVEIVDAYRFTLIYCPFRKVPSLIG